MSQLSSPWAAVGEQLPDTVPATSEPSLAQLMAEISMLRQEVTESRRDVASLSTEVASQAREIEHLRRQLEAESSTRLFETEQLLKQVTVLERKPATTGMVGAPQVKMPLPDTYDGKDKRKAHEFIESCNNYAEVKPFPNNRAQILFAETLLRDGARDWSRTETVAGSKLASDWAGWSKAFLARHGEADRAGAAMATLRGLTQGNRKLGEYITEFKQLRHRLSAGDRVSDWTFQALWAGLGRGAQQSLAPQYATICGKNDKVQALISALEDLERGWSMVSTSQASTVHTPSSRPAPTVPSWQNRKAAPPPAPTSSATTTTAPPAPKNDPNAMDVDKANKWKRSRGRPADAPSGPQCYNCRGYGHIAPDCPSPAVPRKHVQAKITEKEGSGGESDSASEKSGKD